LIPRFSNATRCVLRCLLGTLARCTRLLWRAGVSQRRIGQLTGQSQSEVCEILKGRQVRDVWVLERIADGLGAPRAWMGLGYGEEGSDARSADEDLDEEMKRRALIAAATAVALGQLAPGVVGEPIEVALPTARELPSRLGICHVHAVRAVTDRLTGVSRYYGGQADVFGAAATLYTRWMQVPATEEDRVGGGVGPPPLTPPDMRARIRRFVKPFGRDAARFG
jgi:transcriptional regulator with XRE-family HTH domain